MAEEYSRKLSDHQDILVKEFKDNIKEVNKKTNTLNIVVAVLFGIIIGLSIQLII
jgi:Mor family transcriptional regulator